MNKNVDIDRIAIKVAESCLGQIDVDDKSKNSILIIMVGMSASGKSTFSKKLAPLIDAVRVATEDINNLVDELLSGFVDDLEIESENYWARQRMKKIAELIILDRLMGNGVNIIVDSCHLVRNERLRLVELAKNNSYKVYYCEMETEGWELICRVGKRDLKSKSWKWSRLYELQRVIRDPITPEEEVFAFAIIPDADLDLVVEALGFMAEVVF